VQKTPASDLLTVIGQNFDGQIPLSHWEEALAIVQKLDPRGVGARDLRECLLLQITPRRLTATSCASSSRTTWRHSAQSPADIQRKTGFELETIKEAIEILKHLNPKPGAAFTADNIPYVVPDIAVDRTEEGDYEVKLLDDWTPNIYISRRYIDMYRDKAAIRRPASSQAQDSGRHWLSRAIEQRRNTLAKVTRAIIKHQKAFLDAARAHRTFEDAADRRPGGRACHDGQPAVDDKWVQTAARHLPVKRFSAAARKLPPAKR